MNDRLARLLSGERAPGVYRFTSRAGVAAIAGEAGRCGWRFFYLDGRRIASKSDLLPALAAAMGFPGYFGHNWDALEDNLRDLAWAPAGRGYLLLYDGAGRLATASPQDFEVLLGILQSAVEFWRQSGTPMAVLLRGLGHAAHSLPEL